MARRFSVIQGGLAAGLKAKPGRTKLEAVAERVELQRPGASAARAPIPAQAFLSIRPKGWAPEAA